jgi:DNA-binding NtrC family response regulator
LMVWQGGPFDFSVPGHSASQAKESHVLSLLNGKTLREASDDFTLTLCRQALEFSGGNKTEAAKMLGISRAALYRLLERLEMTCADETE